MEHFGCPSGPLGAEGPPGPPTLLALIREWIEEDPTLKKHFHISRTWNEGCYIETDCTHKHILDGGWSIARFPPEESEDKRIMVFHHGQRRYNKENSDAVKVRGYLKREDPQFLEKLRDFMVRAHDAISDRTNCRIKYEFGDLLPDYERYERQDWWADGQDL